MESSNRWQQCKPGGKRKREPQRVAITTVVNGNSDEQGFRAGSNSESTYSASANVNEESSGEKQHSKKVTFTEQQQRAAAADRTEKWPLTIDALQMLTGQSQIPVDGSRGGQRVQKALDNNTEQQGASRG
ncbi:hypothetical protein NDU88_002868 [Pleurodeles waltl]|uniref:Uncharacterized protein n=1 Tax=Pleurodeles waltl TaxID=8319 RepID=A0AAV7SEQ3_PLEWA|nr:hypothetical protein NDU88_002868 [Pleurodeles waltl]